MISSTMIYLKTKIWKGASTALQWLEAMRARLAVRGAHTGDNHSAIAMLIR